MTNEDADSREQGIEFGALAEDLESETYPLSHERLLEQYGDRELELADGETSLGEVLEAENETEYEDAESVRQAIFMMVGGDAVGREEYSDRGGNSGDMESDESV
jgi:CII-binding regulator of phage lambda lysogenization HflD